jgi:hypothetical protein
VRGGAFCYLPLPNPPRIFYRADMDRRVTRSVALVPERWEIVDAFRERMGFNSTSTTIAQIVSEWVALAPQPDGKDKP